MDDQEPETQEEMDRYIQACSVAFWEVVEEAAEDSPLTYRQVDRASRLLWVVSQAQVHLSDSIVEDREAHEANLGKASVMARAFERGRAEDVSLLIVARSVTDCWTPVGQFAEHLLTAVKCSITALLIGVNHPVTQIGDIPCPDGTALITASATLLGVIGSYDGRLEYEDYAVEPNNVMVERMTWQKAGDIHRGLGGQPPSAN